MGQITGMQPSQDFYSAYALRLLGGRNSTQFLRNYGWWIVTISKQSRAYIQASENLHGLTDGLVVSIDPSIGSNSSMPGWAVYRASKYVESGTFKMNPRDSVPDRLRTLHNYVRKLYIQYPPDVLVYEEIPSMRQGGGNAEAHASLLKALGAILSVPGPDGYVGIMPISWKKMVREDYIKGDERDAVEIGHIVIELAHEIRYNQKRKGKSDE